MIEVAFRDEEPNGTVAVIVTRPEHDRRLVMSNWSGVRWIDTTVPGDDMLVRLPPRILDAITDAWIAARQGSLHGAR